MYLQEYNKILKRYFGYDSLKPEQYEIIDKLVNEKKDVCAILATGFGKSMCYQLPYLITDKSVIVISPLISLMSDQKMILEKLDIPVCCLNSDTKYLEKMRQMKEILDGESKIIFITPEFLMNCEQFITDLYNNEGIAMVCIDEAHCTSSWGNDFRDSYSKLGCIKDWIPDVPVLAVTATASEKVRKDICKTLKLKNQHMVIGTFDRPNLNINVSRKKNISSDLHDLLRKYNGQYVIIYCKTRDDTENTAEEINKIGIKCYAYHAGLSNSDRDIIQKKFANGEYKCIVATIAFGMGINIPNIRLVIHYSCPKNLESYYQEIGRAGRDGLPSECWLYYTQKDFALNRIFIKDIPNVAYREYQEQEIRNIEKFVYTTECRRKLLLTNFGQQPDMIPKICNNCDNCKNNKKNDLVDFTAEANQILQLIKSLNGKFGMGTYINILRGSTAKNMKIHTNLPMYGCGKLHSIEFWKNFMRLLMNDDYLKEFQIARKFGSTMECTKKGIIWLADYAKCVKNGEIPMNKKILYNFIDGYSKKDVKHVDTENDIECVNKINKNQTNKISKTSKIIKTSKNDTEVWSSKDDNQLCDMWCDNISDIEISKKIGKTLLAIKERKKFLLKHMLDSGHTYEEITMLLHITENNIKKIQAEIYDDIDDIADIADVKEIENIDNNIPNDDSVSKIENTKKLSKKNGINSNINDDITSKSKMLDNNCGKKWSKSDEKILLEKIKEGKKVVLIANEMGRTRGSISARLNKIALEMYEKNIQLDEIEKITRIQQQKIMELHKKKDIENSDNSTEQPKNVCKNEIQNKIIKVIPISINTKNKKVCEHKDNAYMNCDNEYNEYNEYNDDHYDNDDHNKKYDEQKYKTNKKSTINLINDMDKPKMTLTERHKLAIELYDNGTPLEDIISITTLSEDNIMECLVSRDDY